MAEMTAAAQHSPPRETVEDSDTCIFEVILVSKVFRQCWDVFQDVKVLYTHSSINGRIRKVSREAGETCLFFRESDQVIFRLDERWFTCISRRRRTHG